MNLLVMLLLETGKLKNNHRDSSIRIGSKNKFQGDTVIGDHAKIVKKKIVHDSSINYPIGKIDVTNLEKSSIWIINKYGEKKPIVVGVISMSTSIITILSGLNSLLENNKLISWFPSWLTIPSNYAIYVLIVGFVLLSFGAYLLSLVHYKYDSQCLKCKKHYAMREVGTPNVREVKALDGIKRTTTREHKCRYCSFFKKTAHIETVPYEHTNNSK